MGQHIRDQIKLSFSKEASQSKIDQQQCDKYYASLRRLATNQHANLYPRSSKKTASGLNSEQCNLALSPELQEFFNKEDPGILSKLKNTFKKNDDPEVKQD